MSLPTSAYPHSSFFTTGPLSSSGPHDVPAVDEFTTVTERTCASLTCQIIVKGRKKFCDNHAVQCEHGRQGRNCTSCGHNNICEHRRVRIYCRDCAGCPGSRYCTHGKRHETCRQCTELCRHGKQLHLNCSRCREPVIICASLNCHKTAQVKWCPEHMNHCEHGKRGSRCSICDGSDLCVHGQSSCVQCKKDFKKCQHGKRVDICSICLGTSMCQHGKRRGICRTCNAGAYCEHDRLRTVCPTCGDPARFCPHNKLPHKCRQCGNTGFLCKGPACSIYSVMERPCRQIKGLCIRCFRAENPNSSELKMRTEILFLAEIERRLPHIQEEASLYVWDCAIPCTMKEPDFLWVYAESNCSMHFELDESGSRHEDCDTRIASIHAAAGTKYHRLIRASSNSEAHQRCVKGRILPSNGDRVFEAIEPEFTRRVEIICEELSKAWQATKQGIEPKNDEAKLKLFFNE